jgi:hypothetical protein
MFGAGIAAQSMINSLKNNSRKKERVKFFDRENRLNIKKRKCVKKSKEKEVSKQHLLKIKQQIIAQQKKERIFNFVFYIICFIVTIFLLKILLIPFKEALT